MTKKISKNGMLSINPYLIFGFYVILEMIILKVNAFSITCQFFFYISLSKIEKGNQKNCGKIIVLYWEYSEDIHRSSKFMANFLLQKSNQH